METKAGCTTAISTPVSLLSVKICENPWLIPFCGSIPAKNHCEFQPGWLQTHSEMASSINVPRTHLIMGLCLPLAVLLGYFVAQPLDSVSIAVLFMVLALLCVPLFMKWHHPLLILSWNTTANPLFLPGRPALWMLVAIISLLFAVLARSLNSNRRFIQVPSMTKPLLFFTAVVLATALITGGIGIRSLGSDRYGGRSYFYILAAIIGYFAFTSHRIPRHRVGLYIGMFFLSGLTAVVGDAAFVAGPPFYFLTAIFVPDTGMDQTPGVIDGSTTMVRLGALAVAGVAMYTWLLARHGIRGVFTLRQPWRLFLVLLAITGCLVSGYRSSLILFVLTSGCVFCFEGLCRTRLLPIMAALVLLGAMVVLPNAGRLPLMAQRALSFLPAVEVDPIAKESARASTEWRVEMWKQMLPQVPKYLIKGKGYAIDPGDLFLAQQSAHRGFAIQAAASVVAGDYHNGPLSIVIPFGIFGLIGFIWLVMASLRVLYYHYRFGDPAFHKVNTFLLAGFVAKILIFVLIFGGLSSDLYVFLGLTGLSISLNGAPQTATEPEAYPRLAAIDNPLYTG